MSEEQLKRLHAPIGLPIRARTPDEIALAILAQIVAARNKWAIPYWLAAWVIATPLMKPM